MKHDCIKQIIASCQVVEGIPCWPWHDKPFIGAAHGIAGVLTVLMDNFELMNKKDRGFVRGALELLISMQIYGSFPTTVYSLRPETFLTQWYCLSFLDFNKVDNEGVTELLASVCVS